MDTREKRELFWFVGFTPVVGKVKVLAQIGLKLVNKYANYLLESVKPKSSP
jgi:hypothetical protein